MNKLYIGSLPADVNEGSLRQLFQDHSISVLNVLVKKGGYAFVDCPDQTSADKAIDKLNGYNLMGSAIIVEPSVPRNRKSVKVQISNIGSHVTWEEVERLLPSFGIVKRCDHVTDEDNPVVQVTFDGPETAQKAVSSLNGREVNGTPITAELIMDQNRPRSLPRGSGGGGSSGNGGGSGGGGGNRGARGNFQYSGIQGSQGRSTDFPLRILVLSEMVGAIIGRQGGTIRQITQQTRARVDVHRKDNAGSLEKGSFHASHEYPHLSQAITIYGAPENCTNACQKILEVMQQEANNTNKGSEVPLKILAHNNLIGRIIGKGGNTIKRIMQDTDTKLTVSSIHDVNSYNLERIITVKGTIENISKAEALISAKLRQSYENDLAAMAVSQMQQGYPGEEYAAERGRDSRPQSMMYPGLHPMAMMSTSSASYQRGPPPSYGGPYSQGGNGGGIGPGGGGGGGSGGSQGGGPYPPPVYPGQMVPPPHQQQPQPSQETAFVYIPNSAVGAIIGTKGTHIRNIIRFSGASVKIAPVNKDEPLDHNTERKVTIIGSPEAQWKAQYLVFEKLREEGFAGADDVRLKVEMMVPSSQVGRIIGKGGQNVRELQRATGSIVKLPEESHSDQSEETSVHIIGQFYSVQSAQRRVRAMLVHNQLPPPNQRRSSRGPLRSDQN